jgi:hypothetical protein
MIAGEDEREADAHADRECFAEQADTEKRRDCWIDVRDHGRSPWPDFAD